VSRWQVLIALAGLAVGIAVLLVNLDSDHAEEHVGHGILGLLIVWSFVASGLVASARRPENRIGPLMVAMGFSWLFPSLQLANNDVAFTIGLALALVPMPIFVHLVLAFPEGRLEERAALATTGFAYAAGLLLQLLGTFFLVPRPEAGFPCEGECPENLFLITRNDDLAQAFFTALNVAGVLIAIAVVVILSRRWRGATAPARRVLAPVLWSGAITAFAAIAMFVSGISGDSGEVPARLATFAVIALVPLAFLIGLLHHRLARTAVSRLVVELQEAHAPGRLREALARALGDPSLAVAYWLPESRSYVDAVGHPVELPAGSARAAVTIVEREGRRVGALIHDPVLLDQPELVDGVCAVAGLALENERLQAELRARLEQLRASEERLRALIDASPLAIVEADLAARVTFWNRAAERLYGWTSEEVIGAEVPFVPGQKEGEFEALRARMQRGEVVETETTRLRQDGSTVDVALSAAPVYDADGNAVRYMAVLTDITERKRAREELRKERDFTSALIDSAPVLVIVFDREGRLLRFNHECEQLTGYTFAEVQRRDFWDLFILPEEAERVRRRLDEVWAGDFPSTNENHWLTRNGERRLILWSNNALLDERGEVEYIVSAGIDITERKRAEEELRASRARIVEAGDAERRRLERNLHDGAQQRLVALSLALRLAESRVRTDPGGAEQTLREGGDELAQALEELRELARGIHPAVLTDRGLPAALEALAGRAPTPVELELALEERLPPQVEAAAYYVVSEALANVAKYARANAVTVSVGRADGYALVEVADDGIGGADADRGSGLRGLADRVEALDGELEVESPPGSGTRIRARIPLSPAASG
jgi:PAS domain S-box-containing protein